MTNKSTIEEWRKIILGKQYDQSIKELENYSVEELKEIIKEDQKTV